MSQLHQISCRYDAMQDRLLLSVSTMDQAEFRFWLTRRFTHGLITQFKQDTVKVRVETPANVPQTHQKEMADFEQAKHASESNYEKRFEQGTEFPLGENGILVKTINLNMGQGDAIHLEILPDKGEGITLNINRQIFNNFFEVIERALTNSGWFDSVSTPTKTRLQ